MIQLRDYQELGVQQIDIEFRKGNKRVLLVASPGAGKTEMAGWMLMRAMGYNFPSMFIVRGRDLVNNASKRFDKNNIDHSVFMAGNWRLDDKKLVQVCSIDTMLSRKKFIFNDRNVLIFLDEAHLDYSKLTKEYPDAHFIGMTGTRT